MSLTTERKTLSIKSKPGMWQVPSKIENIEKKLQTSVSKILKYFATHYPASTYDDNYRLNHMTTRDLTLSVKEAFQELIAVSRYPTISKQHFEKIAKNVYASLQLEVGEHADKFQEAYEHFMHPKETLPKVALKA